MRRGKALQCTPAGSLVSVGTRVEVSSQIIALLSYLFKVSILFHGNSYLLYSATSLQAILDDHWKNFLTVLSQVAKHEIACSFVLHFNGFTL